MLHETRKNKTKTLYETLLSTIPLLRQKESRKAFHNWLHDSWFKIDINIEIVDCACFQRMQLVQDKSNLSYQQKIIDELHQLFLHGQLLFVNCLKSVPLVTCET